MSSEQDPFSLQGKSILVTGASSGIGRQVAITCSAMGAAVVASGRSPEKMAETMAALAPGSHRSVLADLTDPDARARLVGECGELDGMFFSAGAASIVPFRLVSEKHLRDLMAIDFEAPILLTQRLLHQRAFKRGASIVFNTAIAVKISPAGSAIYSAAKAALHAAARSMATEVARFGIRVNSLELGYIRTPLLERLLNAGLSEEDIAAYSPLGAGTPEDAANCAVFMLSDASRWISRTALTADGGLSIRVSR